MNSSTNNNKPIIATRIEPLVSSHKWTIKNFSSLLERKNVPAGFHVTSPRFLTSWFLRLFPFGDQQDADYVSLFVFQTDSDEIKATAKLSILNKRGEKVCERTVSEVFSKNEDWGYRKFAKRSVVTTSDAGDLTIQCELFLDERFSILKTEQVEIVAEADHPKFESFDFEDLEKLLDDEKFSDISFVVEERLLKAHKNILSLRSPVFQEMIARGDDIRKNRGITIRVKDVRYVVFKELLRFLYSGKVQDLRGISRDLLMAAEKYSVEPLKGVCEKSLCDEITPDNALEYLKFAHDKKLENLKGSAIQVASMHVNELMKTPEFKGLKFELVCDVIREIANKRALENKLR